MSLLGKLLPVVVSLPLFALAAPVPALASVADAAATPLASEDVVAGPVSFGSDPEHPMTASVEDVSYYEDGAWVSVSGLAPSSATAENYSGTRCLGSLSFELDYRLGHRKQGTCDLPLAYLVLQGPESLAGRQVTLYFQVIDGAGSSRSFEASTIVEGAHGIEGENGVNGEPWNINNANRSPVPGQVIVPVPLLERDASVRYVVSVGLDEVPAGGSPTVALVGPTKSEQGAELSVVDRPENAKSVLSLASTARVSGAAYVGEGDTLLGSWLLVGDTESMDYATNPMPTARLRLYVGPQYAGRRIASFSSCIATYEREFNTGLPWEGTVGEDGYADFVVVNPISFHSSPTWTTAIVLTFVLDDDLSSYESPFPDVAKGDWYFNASRFALREGIMGGYADGRFGPADALKRQDVAMILYNYLGGGAGAPDCGLSDVSPGDYYYDAVNWCVAEGIFGGYSDGRLGVGDTITREDLVVVIWRAAGSPGPNTSMGLWDPPTDWAQVSSWAVSAMDWACRDSVINGERPLEGGWYVRPTSSVSRAEAAQIIMSAVLRGYL